MKKVSVISLVLLCLWMRSLEGRPLNDHLEQWPTEIIRTLRQLVKPITAEEAGPPPVPQRGSAEETRRILNEINKINQAFGYTKKSQDIALPRQGPANTNYFYPRPVYQPAFIQNSKRPPHNRQKPRYSRKIDPYKVRAFHFRTPHTQLPPKMHSKVFDKQIVGPFNRKGLKHPIIVQDISLENIQQRIPKNIEELRSDMENLSTTTTQKSTEIRQQEYEYEDEEPVGIIESIVKVIAGSSPEEEEEIDNYENYDSNEESNEIDEETLNIPTLNPPLLNDKFINREQFNDQAEKSRSFNFTTPNFIKNLTEKFSKPNTITPVAPSVITEQGMTSALDLGLREKSQEDYDDSEETSIEGLRAPWSGVFPGGPQSQRDVLKQGGLIIQRLRVKNGSIAVAGPGGVATAGSGGTAIVGPEGLAITHPRALTIAGPGARVYEVPESTNLETQLRSLNADGVPENGVLVAVGPTVHYNSEKDVSSKLVEVDSVGVVSADQPITGYDAYFPKSNESDGPTLILEPQSQAIAGNGGTAISAPVSRAILKRGSNTKVLFKPQSVAIAGAKGKAHASADLIIDYVE